MEQIKLLEKAREKLGVKTDYALAKALGIPNNRISDYLKDKRALDEYACFKIAEVLGDSPSKVIARVLAENAKDEDKRLYFQRFFTIAALWITLALVSVLFSGSFDSAFAAGNNAETRADSTYNPIIRSMKNLFFRLRRWLKLDKNVRYFTCNWHVKPFGLLG